jgi:hypothetical protein
MKTIGGQEKTKFPRPRSRPLDLRLHGGGLQSRAVAQAPGASRMRASANGKLVGRWPIVEADIWDRDYLDLARDHDRLIRTATTNVPPSICSVMLVQSLELPARLLGTTFLLRGRPRSSQYKGFDGYRLGALSGPRGEAGRTAGRSAWPGTRLHCSGERGRESHFNPIVYAWLASHRQSRDSASALSPSLASRRTGNCSKYRSPQKGALKI